MVGSHKYMLLLALVDCLFHKQTSSYALSYTEEYAEFCQQSCSRTGLVPTRKCNACFCDDNCSVFRDCCPDKNKTADNDYLSSCQKVIFPELRKITKLNSETCSSTFKPFRECKRTEFETYENGYKLVTSCLSDFDDPETRRLCQGIDTVLPSTIRPVTDMDTGIAFRNIHCSQCNRVTSNLTMWPLWVICRNELPERFGNSLQQLHHAINNTEGCSIRFAAAEGLDNQRICEADEIIIKTCNVTGKWSGKDTTLKSKCGDSSYHNEVQGYRNMYCFLCNTDDRNTMPSGETTPYAITKEVFGIVNDDFINYPPVNYSIVDSYTGRCRRVMCPDGRQYVNGSCQSLFNRFNGYLYSICLRLEVGAPKSSDYETIGDFKFSYFGMFYQHFQEDEMVMVTYNTSLVKIGPCPGDFINATLELGISISSTQSSISEDENIRYIMSKVQEIPESNIFAPFETFKMYQKPECTSVDLDEETANDICLEYKAPRPSRVYARKEYMAYLYVAKPVVLSKLLMCPQVMLQANEVDFDSEKNEITILANNRSITEVNFQSTNGTYYICMEDYTNITGVVETEGCRIDITTGAPTSTLARLSGSSYAFLLLDIMGIYMCTCYRV